MFFIFQVYILQNFFTFMFTFPTFTLVCIFDEHEIWIYENMYTQNKLHFIYNHLGHYCQ